MVRQSAKKNKQDHHIKNVDDTPVTRCMLKKLARAKAVPEIYKEVVRSKRRKNLFFRVPDINLNSLHISEKNAQELDNNALVNNEQMLTTNDGSGHSENCLNAVSPEVEIIVNVVSDSHQTVGKTTDKSSVSACTTPDKYEELLSKDSTVRIKVLTQKSNSQAVSEGTSITMPPKGSRARKSISNDSRTVCSPGVITRSQLKQLANSKIVPEEYINVITEKHSPECTGEEGKSPDKHSQHLLNNSCGTPRRRRGSNKQSDKEASFEQRNYAMEQGIDDNPVNDVVDSSAESNSKIICKIEGTRTKKKKQNEEVDSGSLRNDRTLEKSDEEICDSDPKSFSVSQNDNMSDKQNISEMEVSEAEIQDLKESFEKSSEAVSKSSNENESEMTDHTNKRHSLKRVVQDKAATVQKVIKTCKGNNNVKSQEILDKLNSKTRTAIAREQRVSICEPVDMSISEDYSSTEKILYCAKSQSSDSEASGTFSKQSKKTLEVSSIKGKAVLLKKDKNSISNKEVTKSPEASSATSSSYTSGYEITPSKSQSMSKECSLSTKTTDSGIAVMLDSNHFDDTDSNSDDKQENHDTAQKFNLTNNTEFKDKDERNGIPRKNPVINNLSSTNKQTNLLSNENTPSCSGKPTPVRQQPFLIRMPVSVDEDIDSDSDAESRKAIMLSAQRRIEQNLSTTDSEGRKVSHRQTPSTSLHGGEDSDDAPPDSMSFEAGRNLASESLRDAVESISRDRQRRKERRRIRLEKLRQQKEEKLIRLKERLASQEDASCSSSEESGYEDEELRQFRKKPSSRERSKAERERLKSKKKSSHAEGRILKQKDFGDETQANATLISNSDVSKRLPDELLERLSEKAPTEMKLPQPGKLDELSNNKNPTNAHLKRKKAAQLQSEQSDELSEPQSFKKPPSLDYIPLKSTSSTKFTIMPFDKIGNVSKSTAQKAAEFRQNMMFGNHHKREPSNANLIYQQKLKASGKDVFARKKY